MLSDEEPIANVDDDLEIIAEDGELENFQNQEINLEETTENEQNDENAEDETKKVVKPKRVVKNPQPKLNEQTLKGPRGFAAIEGYFERVKFKGRGYEESDLNILMKTYEYWCHRLFPKFPFDDCIARLEKLGTKKATQTQIKRIRLDLNFDDDKPLLDDDEENDVTGFVDTNNDQFDQLLPTATIDPVPEMTEEQLERIRQNKERARQLREERLKKMKEKIQEHTSETNEIVGQSSCETDIVTHSQDNEDILEVIEETTTTKKKKRVIESDSEDEIDETDTDKSVVYNRRNILESDDEDRDNEIVIANSDKNSVDGNRSSINYDEVISENDHVHSQNKSQIIESGNESDENDIENILSEINTDESNTQNIEAQENIASHLENDQPMDTIEDTT